MRRRGRVDEVGTRTVRRAQAAGVHIAAALIVAAVAIVAFLPALQGDFLAWDDDRNFVDNPAYRGLGPAQLRWMWTTFHMGHYIPLSWMTLGLDYTLWGMNPAGYHLTNLLLHAAHAVALYFLARRLLVLAGVVAPGAGAIATAVPAAFAALVFAIHPLRVESVAWVTERRDALSGLFSALTLICWLRAGDEGEKNARWYTAALVAYVCALLSKATAMSLPAVMLVLAVYPLRRVGGQAGWWTPPARRTYLELAPFAALGLAALLLSMVALSPPAQLPLGGKVAVSAYSLAFYLWKTLSPSALSPLYEMPPSVDPFAARYLVSYGVAALFLASLWLLRRRTPGAVAALVAFALLLLPMLGVVQNGPQIVAPRYTYHAAPAIAILAGGLLAVAMRRAGPWSAAVAAVVLLALGSLTWSETQVWHDSERLWTRVLERDAESSIAHNGLAVIMAARGQLPDAVDHYRRALAIDPDYAEGHNNLGVALARQGSFAEAIPHYERALALKPGYADAHANWGVAVGAAGDLTGAIAHYERAIALDPRSADAEVNWGNALVRLDRPGDALPHYEAAVRIREGHADAERNWGVALARLGRIDDAIPHFRRATELAPGDAQARAYLDDAERIARERQR
jgi:protein O-mannosyl-transferase